MINSDERVDECGGAGEDLAITGTKMHLQNDFQNIARHN